MGKTLATVKTDNPVGFAAVLHDVAENQLQRLHHSELCGLLRSAVVASINVAYTDCKACIHTTTGRICRHLEEHALQLRPKDLVDVAASLALWQGGGGEQLRNIIRQRQSELDEHRTTHDVKGLHRSHSITSLSTADHALPVRELRAMLREQGVSAEGCIEKRDLVNAVKQFRG